MQFLGDNFWHAHTCLSVTRREQNLAFFLSVIPNSHSNPCFQKMLTNETEYASTNHDHKNINSLFESCVLK